MTITQNNAAAQIPSVLIVDDIPEAGAIFRDLIREQLDPRTHVFEAADGQTALTLARRHAIDVALVDYHLPDIDGLRLIAQLQETDSNPATMLVTGIGSEQLAAEAIKRGAHEYIAKADLHRADLGTRIRQAMEAKQEERRAEEESQQLRRDHEELDHLVRALSHDMNANFMLLSNSFAQLKRASERVAMPEVQEKMIHLDACLAQSRRFLGDLITLGKTGRVDMQPEVVDLADIVQSIRFEQRDLLAERGITFSVEGELPQLWSNAARVKQIVTNLVRNAARHGCDAIRPRITIRGGQAFGPGAMAWFRVADNGRGIDRKYREEIFKPGARLPSAHPQGSGIGLAIVDKMARAMAGSVRVVDAAESAGSDVHTPRVTSGAVFEVRLPAASVAAQDTISARPARSGDFSAGGARVDGAETGRPANSLRVHSAGEGETKRQPLAAPRGRIRPQQN